jgi:hypothetical protein
VAAEALEQVIPEPPTASPFRAQAEKVRTLQCLYLFAGPSRSQDLPAAFSSLASSPDSPPLDFVWRQVDIVRDKVLDDLLLEDVRQSLLDDIAAGRFDLVIASPPCSSFSRAVYADKEGPKPVRSFQYPLGFPWASNKSKAKAEAGNVLAYFAIAAMRTVAKSVASGSPCIGLVEHPEDLGKASLGIPAAIWQFPEMVALHSHGFRSAAFYQCSVGGSSRKPTRVLSNSRELSSIGLCQDATFDINRMYLGPLPLDCGHHDHVPFRGKEGGYFLTTPSAAYPQGVNALLAHMILNELAPPVAPPAARVGLSRKESSIALPQRVEMKSGLPPPGSVYVGRWGFSRCRTPPLGEPFPGRLDQE